MAEPDEAAWIEALYVEALNDDSIRAHALDIAQAMRQPDDPEVLLADLTAAQRYLKKCLTTRTADEVAALRRSDFAALLARGALGSARYRAAGGRTGHSSDRARRRGR